MESTAFVAPSSVSPNCPHCLEPFRGPPSLLLPKLLPCGHNVCEGCMRVIMGSTTPHCPVCCDGTPLPPLSAMPANTALAMYVEEMALLGSTTNQSASLKSPGRVRRPKSTVRVSTVKFCDDCRKFDESLKEAATFVCISCTPSGKDVEPGQPPAPGRYLCPDDVKRLVLAFESPEARRLITALSYCYALEW